MVARLLLTTHRIENSECLKISGVCPRIEIQKIYKVCLEFGLIWYGTVEVVRRAVSLPKGNIHNLLFDRRLLIDSFLSDEDFKTLLLDKVLHIGI